MANTVTLLSYANTFGDWVITTNKLVQENNTLASGSYNKTQGTLIVSDPVNAFSANGPAYFYSTLQVLGTGSSGYIQNNLRVDGQVYFTNTTLGLTNSGQANIGGHLLALSSGTGLTVSNNANINGILTVGGNANVSGILTVGGLANSNTLLVRSDANVSGSLSVVGSLYSGPVYENGIRLKTYIDTTYLPLSGGTISGNLNVSNNFSANNFSVSGNFTVSGSTVYNTPQLVLSASSPNPSYAYYNVYRSPGANASIRWNESSQYWDILDVGSLTYNKLLTSEYLTNSVTTSNSSLIATASAANTLNNSIISTLLIANQALGIAQSTSPVANSDYTFVSITPGTTGNSTSIPSITVAANGRIIAISNTSITVPPGTSIYANSGQLTANASTGVVAIGLGTTGVTATTYGNTSTVPSITVDSFGRITSASNTLITLTNITDDNSTNTIYYPLLSQVVSGSLLTANTSSTGLNFNPSTGTLLATIFDSLSDINQKTNIQKIENALNIVQNLNGFTFEFKDSGKSSVGLIAQEVEQIVPSLVTMNNGFKTLNYNGIIGILLEAIKELKQEVDELKGK